jgi:hypothetical protein
MIRGQVMNGFAKKAARGGALWRGSGEEGMVIVEAAAVFPVVFLVVFFLIVWGNVFYSASKAEDIARRTAIKTAALAADPLLGELSRGAIPSLGEIDVKPYRYILGADPRDSGEEAPPGIETAAIGTGLFAGMAPKAADTGVAYENRALYSKVAVSVSYSVVVPVRPPGAGEFLSAQVSAYSAAPVTDAPEFIRNVNMARDYAVRFGANTEISQAVESAKRLLKGGSAP